MRNAVFAVVAVLVSIPAAAQNAGDTIFVTDRNGIQTDGVLLRTAVEGLTLLVHGQERLIPASGVGRVEKRDSRWNGMLIGAVPGALIGLMGAGASCSPHCGRDVPIAALINGAIGAGIGALIDSQIDGYSSITGPSLSPPNARRTPPPVGSLDQLWQRVREGDTIEVATIRGHKVRGQFVQASQSSVTLTAVGVVEEIPSSDVRRVTRRGNRYRSGALWGGALVGTAGAVASARCSGGSSECGNPAFVGIAVGGAGALWGTIIGALIPKHPVVFGSDTASGVRVAPVLQVGRVGVAFSTRF
jgi:hypothetical protein